MAKAFQIGMSLRAIGCVIVILMKGPAFGADGYPLNDSDVPEAAKLKKNAT